MKNSRLVLAVVVTLAAVLLVASPSAGPDLGFYLDWAEAALAADVFKLHGSVLSPLGVPLSQWSAGPGLLFASGKLLVGGLAGVRDAALAVGSVAALVWWWALATLLGRAAEGRGLLVVFGAGAALVGTHAGFYSHSHASESLSYGACGLMLVLLTAPGWRTLDALKLGAAAALLLLIRPQHALYAVPALALGAARTWRTPATSRARAFVFLAAPLALSAGIAAAVNRWMTGSLLRSPYAFGGAGFLSLDFQRPELAAVLLHPYHGLLPYHPLYGVGFAALAACLWRSRDVEERAVWLAGLLAVMAHLYLQASWYVWWMGTLSFGMRGLALAAVVLVPALVRVIARTAPDGVERLVWIAAAVGCGLWSALQLLQRHGAIRTWPELFASQQRGLKGLLPLEMWGPLAVGLALAAAAVWALRPEPRQGMLAAAAALLAGLGLGYLLYRACGRWLRRGAPEELRVELLVLVLAAAALLPVVAVARGRGVRLREAMAEGLAWSAAASLVVAGLLFLRLAAQTEERITAGVRPTRPMRYAGSVELDQAREAYYEYLELPGFDQKKAALRAFLEANGVQP
jgi:hypothetical protein